MRVCLLSRNDHVGDPRARALRASLQLAGHEVYVVACGRRPRNAPSKATYIGTSRPAIRGPLGLVLRRLLPAAVREALLRRALVHAVRELEPDIVYPTSSAMVGVAADAVGDAGVVVRDPRYPAAGARDLVWVAPHDPSRAQSPGGPGEPFHTPDDGRSGWAPEPGRYSGQAIAIAYRKTDSNPGRYLEEALRRAGFEVLLFTDRIDIGALPEDLRALVFVEGPYPALDVVGPPASFPIIFWVHHGEHHLAANLRLALRYRADAILLAHSWHLAHRFHVPVHRFPFGTAPDLFDGTTPWRDRRYDVAMVGAHLRGGGPYARRGELVRVCEQALGVDRTAFLEGVTSHEMADAYNQARIIINEGGTRHFPITMRVWEAMSAGALLLTDPVPGLDLLLKPAREFVHIRDDLAAQLRELLDEPSTSDIARRAFERGRSRHTYDHRIDELVQVIEATTPGGRHAPELISDDPLARALARDVEVQRVLVDGHDDLVTAFPDREVWDVAQVRDRLAPGSFEAVLLRTEDVSGQTEVLRAARRFLYLHGRADGLAAFLDEHHPEAVTSMVDEVTRVDLGADSYAIKPHEVVDG